MSVVIGWTLGLSWEVFLAVFDAPWSVFVGPSSGWSSVDEIHSAGLVGAFSFCTNRQLEKELNSEGMFS